jgi:hypothetical protein
MKLSELLDLLTLLSVRYENAKVYLQMYDETNEKMLEPSLLQDISEVTIDVEDDVIVIRSIVRYRS